MNRFGKYMSDARYEQIVEAVKAKGMRMSYRDFTPDEITNVILPSCVLTQDEKVLATLKFAMATPTSVLMERYYVSKSTMNARLKKLSLKLRTTCTRIFAE